MPVHEIKIPSPGESITEVDIKNADTNKPNKLKEKCIVPGLDTINTPTKPTKTAAHLLYPTFSLRKKKDITQSIRGALNKIG